MTVTNKFKNEAMKIYGTKRARFEDSSDNPIPEVFASREDYEAYAGAMYDLISNEYRSARQAGTAEGLPILIGVCEEVKQIKEQLGSHFQGFKDGLRVYAERVLGKTKATDLMDTIKNFETGGVEDKAEHERKRLRVTSKYQTNGFRPGETGYAHEIRDENGNVIRTATDEDMATIKKAIVAAKTKQGEAHLNAFFGCD